jgi:hypothetical protein
MSLFFGSTFWDIFLISNPSLQFLKILIITILFLRTLLARSGGTHL